MWDRAEGGVALNGEIKGLEGDRKHVGEQQTNMTLEFPGPTENDRTQRAPQEKRREKTEKTKAT